jgi:hypothetical protein
MMSQNPRSSDFVTSDFVTYSLNLPTIKQLIENSELKSEPQKALQRPFFYGIKGTKFGPAYTEASVKRRMEQESDFCLYCFMYNEHTFKCKYSGWGEFF